MLSIYKKYQGITSKFYLYIYAISVFVLQFTGDSQINGYMPGEQNKLGNSVYLFTLFATVLLNYIILFTKCRFNIHNKYLLISLLLLLLYLPRIFSNYQIIDSYTLMSYILIVNAFLISPYDFLKVNFWTRFASVSFIIVCSLLHLFPSGNGLLMVRNGSIRYTLGFIHPNTLALAVFSVVLSLILYSSVKKINIAYVYVSFVILIFISIISQSREVEVSSIVLIILFLFYKLHCFSNILNYVVIIIAILSLLLTIYVVFIMNKGAFYWKIDKLLSYRPNFAWKSFQIYPVRFLGYKMAPALKMINASSSLDNLYLNSLFNYGIIGLLIFEIMIFKSCSIAIKYNEKIFCVILISLLLTYISATCNEFYFIYIYVFAIERYKELAKGNKV